jgi:hypothetical protein
MNVTASRLKVSEDRIAWVILGPAKEEVRGEWRKLHEFNLRYPKSSIEDGGLLLVGRTERIAWVTLGSEGGSERGMEKITRI